MTVVLAGRTTDPELDALEVGLAATGVEVHRLGAGDPGGTTPPTVCWSREPLGAVPAGPAEVFVRESWAVVTGHLERTARYAVPGPRLGLLDQLADARRYGVRVPATTLTTGPVTVPSDRVVVKVVGRHFVELPGGFRYGVPARVVDREELATWEWPGWPLIVQEYVEHRSEQRVYYLDGRLIAFEVAKATPHSPWSEPDAVEVTPATPDAEIRRVVVGLARRWRLLFGAFDLLRTDRGVVFLEVNHDGDWRWYEARAGVRMVSAAALRMVRDLHLRAGGSLGPTDLIGLLAS